MGAYLSEPIKDKDVESGENGSYLYSVAAMQGWRTEMEDAHLATLGLKGQTHTSVFGVFDGHGGKEVAKFTSLHFVEELLKNESFIRGDVESAMRATYLRMDELMMEEGSQRELAMLSGHHQESEDLECRLTDFENLDIPDILRQALQATRRDLETQRQQFQMTRANQVTSFPLDCTEIDDDEEDDDDQHAEFVLVGDGKELQEEDGEIEATSPIYKRHRGSPAGNGIENANGEFGMPDGAMVEEHKELEDGKMVPQSPDGLSDEEFIETDSPQTPLNVTIRRDLLGGIGGMPAELEREETEGGGPLAGCTAIVAYLSGKRLVVANAGDSRCVASRGGQAIPMSKDHKPTDPLEEERIKKAGGFVTDGRVNGSLNMSRALGDMEYKKSRSLPPEEQMVSAFPDVRTLDLKRGDDFCILACDGIWDVLTEQQAVDFVHERLQRSMPVDQIVEEMCDACLAKDTEGTGEGCDNMTAMVVILKKFCTFKDAHLNSKNSRSSEGGQKE